MSSSMGGTYICGYLYLRLALDTMNDLAYFTRLLRRPVLPFQQLLNSRLQSYDVLVELRDLQYDF